MRLLIIGGTVFLGRALVDSALQRGHQITFLSQRYRSTPALPIWVLTKAPRSAPCRIPLSKKSTARLTDR
jgi:uncharacterized protein YbjT (DUF2867 family)